MVTFTGLCVFFSFLVGYTPLHFSYIIKTALKGRKGRLVRQQGIYVLSKMCLHLSFDDLMYTTSRLRHSPLFLFVSSFFTTSVLESKYDKLESHPPMIKIARERTNNA